MIQFLIGMALVTLSANSTAMAEQPFDCTPSPEHHCLMPYTYLDLEAEFGVENHHLIQRVLNGNLSLTGE